MPPLHVLLRHRLEPTSSPTRPPSCPRRPRPGHGSHKWLIDYSNVLGVFHALARVYFSGHPGHILPSAKIPHGRSLRVAGRRSMNSLPAKSTLPFGLSTFLVTQPWLLVLLMRLLTDGGRLTTMRTLPHSTPSCCRTVCSLQLWQDGYSRPDHRMIIFSALLSSRPRPNSLPHSTMPIIRLESDSTSLRIFTARMRNCLRFLFPLDSLFVAFLRRLIQAFV